MSGGASFFAGIVKALVACALAAACTAGTSLGLTAALQGSEFWKHSQAILSLAIFGAFLFVWLKALRA